MATQSRAIGTIIVGGTRFLGATLQLISLRLMLHVLGAEMNGAFYFLCAASVWLAMTDLSIYDGGTRLVTIAEANGNKQKVHQIWHTIAHFGYLHCLASILIFAFVGYIIKLNGVTSGEPQILLWVAISMMYSSSFFYVCITNYFSSLKEFKTVSIIGLISVIANAILSSSLVFLTKSLTGYVMGITTGYSIAVLYGVTLIHKDRKERGITTKFDKDVFKECWTFAKKSFVNRICFSISRSSASIVMERFGGLRTNFVFGSGAKIPETLNEALPIQRMYAADLTRAHNESPEAFAKELSHATQMSLFSAFALIWIPSSAGDGLLRLYLGREYSPIMYNVLLIIAFYIAVENLLSSIGGAAAAIGQPQRLSVFFIFSAIASALLVVPFYRLSGVLGLALLRVTVHLAQFIPMVYFVKKVIAPDIDARKWVNKLLAITSVALVIGAGNFAIMSLEIVTKYPVISIFLIPISSILYIIICDRCRIIRVPLAIREKLPIINNLCP